MKEKELNTKTPQWFKDWHANHYKPIKSQVGRNTKIIYIILAAILASSLAANGSVAEVIAQCLKVFANG